MYRLDDHAPRLGDAKEAVASLLIEVAFDLVVMDADKEGYPNYFLEAKRSVRRHGTIMSISCTSNKAADTT